MFQFLSVILVILILGIIPIVHAQNVPDWVKNTAGWWATDAISETEFVNAIEYLVNDGIIQVTSSPAITNSETVPDCVKNTTE